LFSIGRDAELVRFARRERHVLSNPGPLRRAPIVHCGRTGILSKQDTPFKLAIVGCGAITELGHAPGALATQGVVLQSLVDVDLDRARALGKRFGIADCRATIDGLESAVDGVVAALPHHLHEPIGVELLRRGLHVLMEKPLGCSTAECRALARAAADARRVLATGLFRRFSACNRLAKTLIANQTLGRVVSFEIRDGRMFSWPIKTNFLLQKDYPGRGVLIGNGSHFFDLVLWWFGPVDEVECVADSRNGGETDAVVELLMASGARGTLRLSRIRDLDDAVVIRFERGVLELPAFGANAKLSTPGGERLMGVTPLLDDPLATSSESMAELMSKQILDFVTAARGGPGPEVGPEMATEAIRLVERCAAAIRVAETPWRRHVAPHESVLA
jgi:predicted dehydrogenase